MTLHDFALLSGVIIADILVTIIMAVYRGWRRAKRGPSTKEFADAVVMLTRYMAHFNRTHGDSQMVEITVSFDKVNATYAKPKVKR